MKKQINLIRCGRSLGECTTNGIKRYLITNGGLRSLLTDYEYGVWNEVREQDSLTDFQNGCGSGKAYVEAVSRLISLNLLISVDEENIEIWKDLYLTRNGNNATYLGENRVATTLMTGVSYELTEEQFWVWKVSTGKSRAVEIHDKFRQVKDVHNHQTMYRLMTTVKLLVDYRLCELEYWKTEEENKRMKREVMMGVGEGLGKLSKVANSNLYGVNFSGEQYELEDSVYRVWELAKRGQYGADEFSKKMGIGKGDMDVYLSCLSEVNMVLNWGYHIEKRVFETHKLVAKGLIVGKDEDNFLFKEVQEGCQYTLPIIPTTIWKLSDPFTNKTIEMVLEELVNLTGYSYEEARYEVIGWVPYLVGSGLIIIDGVKIKSENESNGKITDQN